MRDARVSGMRFRTPRAIRCIAASHRIRRFRIARFHHHTVSARSKSSFRISLKANTHGQRLYRRDVGRIWRNVGSDDDDRFRHTDYRDRSRWRRNGGHHGHRSRRFVGNVGGGSIYVCIIERRPLASCGFPIVRRRLPVSETSRASCARALRHAAIASIFSDGRHLRRISGKAAASSRAAAMPSVPMLSSDISYASDPMPSSRSATCGGCRILRRRRCVVSSNYSARRGCCTIRLTGIPVVVYRRVGSRSCAKSTCASQ